MLRLTNVLASDKYQCFSLSLTCSIHVLMVSGRHKKKVGQSELSQHHQALVILTRNCVCTVSLSQVSRVICIPHDAPATVSDLHHHIPTFKHVLNDQCLSLESGKNVRLSEVLLPTSPKIQNNTPFENVARHRCIAFVRAASTPKKSIITLRRCQNFTSNALEFHNSHFTF